MQFLIQFVGTLFDLMSLAIVARILMSWFRAGRSGPIAQFLYDVTEPILGPARRVVPRIGMLDFSPIVVLIALDIVQGLLINILVQI